MNSKLEFLVIHCSASREGSKLTAADIKAFHLRPKEKGGRGWSKPGYSDVIELDGKVVNLVAYNSNQIVEQNEMTFGAVGLNYKSRHVCYVGGCDKNMKAKDTRTPEQKEALKAYVLDFKRRHPQAKIIGHNQVAAKSCPSFDVQKWLKEIGL